MLAQAPNSGDNETKMLVRKPLEPAQMRQLTDRILQIKAEKAPFAVAEETFEFEGRKLSFDWTIREVDGARITIDRSASGKAESRDASIAEFVHWQRIWVGTEKSEAAQIVERLKHIGREVVVETGRLDYEGKPAIDRGWQVKGMDYMSWNAILSRDKETRAAPVDTFVNWQMRTDEEARLGRKLAQKMMEEGLEAAVETAPGSPGVPPKFTTGWQVTGISDDDKVNVRRKLGEATGTWSAQADAFGRWQVSHERLTGGPRLEEYERAMQPENAIIPITDPIREIAKTPEDILMRIPDISALPAPKEHPK